MQAVSLDVKRFINRHFFLFVCEKKYINLNECALFCFICNFRLNKFALNVFGVVMVNLEKRNWHKYTNSYQWKVLGGKKSFVSC